MSHVVDRTVYVDTEVAPPYSADCGACNWHQMKGTEAEIHRAAVEHIQATHRPPQPEFTDEQVAWLRDVLQLRCCHVTGDHDPLHFKEQRYICDMQQGAAWTRAVLALGFDDLAIPATVEPYDGCFWCSRRPERANGP